MREVLTFTELFALFDRSTDAERELGAADSIEYLHIVTYLVKKYSKEA